METKKEIRLIKPSDDIKELLEVSRLAPSNAFSSEHNFPSDFEIIMAVERRYVIESMRFREIKLSSTKKKDSSIEKDKNLIGRLAWNETIEFSKKYNFQDLVSYIETKFKYEVTEWGSHFSRLTYNCKVIRGIAEVMPNILSGKSLPNNKRRVFNNKKHAFNKLDGNLFKCEIQFVPQIQSQFYINEDGEIKEQPNSLLQTLREIELHRLRICPICNYVFWAYKSHQKWCSAKCKSNNSKQKIQLDPKRRNARNEQRRSNYRRKKEMEERRQ